MQRQILSNANIVTPTHAVQGSLVVEDGRIAEIIPGRTLSEGVDLTGQLLIPGIIDIHTDYLEKELHPRPTAGFPLPLAFHMMDVRAIGCGITTVLGAARISRDVEGKATESRPANGLELARAYQQLRQTALARHYIHLRWNTNFEPADDILEEILKLDSVGNLVFNDPTPGERQFRDIENQIRRYADNRGVPLEEARAHFDARREAAARFNNRAAVAACAAGRLPLGSHDDTTVEHVIEAHANGVTLCEMPCSLEAARKAKELGMMVCMGAPNYYRGGSHCGNLGAPEALDEGLVDILCSDFHFPSLLASAIKMMEEGKDPAAAINLIALHPARHLRLAGEIGSIEEGKKADLVAFRVLDGFAKITHVWVDGCVRIRMNAVTETPVEAAAA